MKEVELMAYSMVYEYLLGRAPSARTYNDRIIAQKIGYITKSQGIYLGANLDFFWHKRGPYSRALTSLLFGIESNKQEIQEKTKNLKIKSQLLPKLDYVKSIIESRPSSCSEVHWLEIYASLIFLNKEKPWLDKEALKETLLSKKPFLEDFSDEIDRANSFLFNVA